MCRVKLNNLSAINTTPPPLQIEYPKYVVYWFIRTADSFYINLWNMHLNWQDGLYYRAIVANL